MKHKHVVVGAMLAYAMALQATHGRQEAPTRRCSKETVAYELKK